MLLVRFAQGKAGEPLPVSKAGQEIVRPAVAVDGKGKVVVAWSENHSGNFDLMSRGLRPVDASR